MVGRAGSFFNEVLVIRAAKKLVHICEGLWLLYVQNLFDTAWDSFEVFVTFDGVDKLLPSQNSEKESRFVVFLTDMRLL